MQVRITNLRCTAAEQYTHIFAEFKRGDKAERREILGATVVAGENEIPLEVSFKKLSVFSKE